MGVEFGLANVGGGSTSDGEVRELSAAKLPPKWSDRRANLRGRQ